MGEIGKTIIIAGIILIVIGILVMVAGKVPGVGRLPGDIFIKKENFSFYFPLTTCILLSIIISIVMYFWGKK
ncbi:MAG: DUF2905 domain-containing protein [Candidatus Omnitrophica bacterium]|nr:DUF2905 domain-containing protein [Candidatus Omnitrophota bacterium]MDE2009948.1 DUF2905 domain-containing protein [Candidatus Omnitrophota bacterium]MDE2213926.1 DUF2905 domain-containing protein [Candidatus Omnitrophota bacterium]MDE2231924.1 DUF2905 domain-containing protein [Candidatus Omnitrophota bacterium]